MKGTEIVVSAEPRGRTYEGIVSGTPKPGTHAQIKTAVEPVQSRHTWEIWNPVAGGNPSLGGDGARGGPITLFDINHNEGKLFSDAYVTATRCYLFMPHIGDECNVRKADIAGTSSVTEDLAIGDRLLVVQGTGLVSKVAVGLIASPPSYPWQVMETLVDQPVEWLFWCIRTGD